MLDGLFIVSIIGACVQLFKEAFEPTIPAENWANKELYQKDVMDGVSIKQRIKNVESGKYKQIKAHPKPHTDKDGKIIIENTLLYEKDYENYGAYQTMKWIKEGKYNLTPEELKKEHERINKKYEYLKHL